MEAVSPSHFCAVQRQHLTTSALDIHRQWLNSDIATAFPNLAKVGAIENRCITGDNSPDSWAFLQRHEANSNKVYSRLGEDAPEHTMCICIEGPDQLSDDVLESVADHYKRVKKRKLDL